MDLYMWTMRRLGYMATPASQTLSGDFHPPVRNTLSSLSDQLACKEQHTPLLIMKSLAITARRARLPKPRSIQGSATLVSHISTLGSSSSVPPAISRSHGQTLQRSMGSVQPQAVHPHNGPSAAASGVGGEGQGKPLFDKILIANRGEIACRIIRTARKLGVKTVAVYSEADKDCMHVAMADEAYCIGPAPSAESYLVMDRIIAVAKVTGAQAIHPGYGFLSESPIFAERVQTEGLVFIGPPAQAIKSMGSKRESKEIMLAAGVPCVPGYHGADQDMATIKEAAKKVGYPLLIKPTHGGGGKGMRVVRNHDDLEEEVLSAKREAIKSFGNDEVLLERWLERPRHVEVQVFGDTFGDCVALWERDCSVQRRHQKIIEEAPAPGMSSELKRDFADKAVAAAKAVNYVGAGTVEFIMDATTDEYFFMEMNTRLQVEHPVTEMVTGVDLVEWQLSIASGNPLPMKQEQIPCMGHAFEARIYAEKPESNFLPDAGRLIHTRAPVNSPHRLETGFVEGDEVSSYYDPMIAKLIVHGRDRAEALSMLNNALGEYQVVGPSTNVEFLKQVAGHPEFAKGSVETSFIPTHEKELFPAVEVPTEILAQAALYLSTQSAQSLASSTAGPWSSLPFRRFGAAHEQKVEFEQGSVVVSSSGNGTYTVRGDDGYQITARPSLIGGTELTTQFTSVSGGGSGGKEALGNKMQSTIIPQGNRLHVFTLSTHHILTLKPQAALAESTASSAQSSDNLVSPMPANVIDVKVKEGDEVKNGQVCVVLESMKMEINIRAGKDGVVKKVGVKKGGNVEEGNVLVVLE